jgi:hypothetical protein
MQPVDIRHLEELIDEGGVSGPIKIMRFGRQFIDSQIDNGTLGPHGPVHLQKEVFIHVDQNVF